LPEGRHPVNVQDVARALAWVHDQVGKYGGDPNKIFLMGHSAGAHLAALVATDSRPLQAAGKDLTLLKGVIPLDTNAYDLPALAGTDAKPFYSQIFGDEPEVLRDASPLHHVAADKGIPPMLICYSSGMGAVRNPQRSVQANAFARALRAAGVHAEVVDASDRNHGEINARLGDPRDEKVTGKARKFLAGLLKSDGCS
jgi:acetyl esterase/lipase